MPNPRPDFAQFAERAHVFASAEQVDIFPQKTDFFQIAECHARLLETIQQWARDNGDDDRLTLSAGELAAKAHIRSLLEHG